MCPQEGRQYGGGERLVYTSCEEGLSWSGQAGEGESQEGFLIVNLQGAARGKREYISSGWFTGLPSLVFGN